ncbi:MAG: PDZ domain-containing protein, partial [Gammaproteobacteria bacterium]
RHDADTERLAQDLRKLCEHHIRFFGEPAPMERYLFQVMAVGDGYGGLEHRSSTSLLCSRNDLPRRTARKMSEEYRRFLGLCSHEYFHTWNVKRIMPAAFQPYDLTREVHTTLLWAFEGITSYYDDLALVRAGIISRDDYLELLGQNVTRLLRGSGRLKQSVAESSFDAWTKYYKQDENAPNSVVSYYTKGGLIALALDLTIRRATDNARSLDDVMRALWERHGKTGIGVTEEGLERLIEEVSGVPLQPFFDQALRGTEDLPLAELLGHVGVEFHLRPAESATDKGGKPAARDESELAALPSLGIRTGDDPAGAKVINVFDGGAAQEAGVSAGDVILAIDGLRATHTNLEGLLASRVPGDRIKVHLFRRDELMEFDVTLRAAPHDTCYLRQQPDLDAATQARLASWLGGGNG